MKNNIKYLVLFMSLLVPSLIFSGTYHVSLNGSDANNGSKATPFRTIKKGVSILVAGDTLLVHKGNYGFEYDIRIKNSGTIENPIVIMAEEKGEVFLNGLRKADEVEYTHYEDGKTSSFVNNEISNIVIDGFYVSNYSSGIVNKGSGNSLDEKSKNITIKNCTLHNNGSDGVTNARVDNILISNCTFISNEMPQGRGWNSIQDYGTNFYSCNNAVVENCYFYGEHNQAISFKEGDNNGVVRKNIFEGVGHFAIFLGQNRIQNETDDNKNPTCKNLVAEYNIIRPTNGMNEVEPQRKYRTKVPIVIDNVDGAIVRYNYIEGFDDGNKNCGINIYNEARGSIDISNNIVAFGVDNLMSGGVFQDWGFENKTDVQIHHNTFYKVSTDFINLRHEADMIWHFKKNLAWKTPFYESNTDFEYNNDNYRCYPQFINGDPVQQEITTKAVKRDFDSYYKKLTEPFRLKVNSQAKGFGVQLK